MERLLGDGSTVHARDRWPSAASRACPSRVVKIVDVKCPGSGEADKNDWDNLDALAPHDEVKFVIKDRADYEFARDVIARYDLADRAAAVLFSPVHGVLDPRTLSEWMLADHLPVATAAAAPQVHLAPTQGRLIGTGSDWRLVNPIPMTDTSPMTDASCC